MDNFEMPASAFAADKNETEKRIKDLEYRVKRLEDVVMQFIKMVEADNKDAT